ncbi:MAG: GNAT family N-acetyltransferase [Geminicoccaceae bacterium]
MSVEPTIDLTDAPAEADETFLRRSLLANNRGFLGEADHRALGLILRHGGEIVGGLIGETGRSVLYVDVLWVAQDWRHRGQGSRLLCGAEAESLQRGCRTAWLDTYDFQARPFYERHGYAVFAELDDLPGGHRRWFMKKRLVPSTGRP